MKIFRRIFLAISLLTVLNVGGFSLLAEAQNESLKVNLSIAKPPEQPESVKARNKWPELNIREISEYISPSDLGIREKLFWGIKTAINHIDVAKIVPVSVYSLDDICVDSRIDPKIFELGALNFHIEESKSNSVEAWIDWRDSADKFCHRDNGYYQNQGDIHWETIQEISDTENWVKVTEDITKDLIGDKESIKSTKSEQSADDYILMFGNLGRFDVEPKGKYWLFCNDKQTPNPNSICYETFSVSPHSQHRKLTN